jgi:hypothetical protein
MSIFHSPLTPAKFLVPKNTDEDLFKKVNKRGLNGFLQSIGFTLYALIVNMDKLNKATAIMVNPPLWPLIHLPGP